MEYITLSKRFFCVSHWAFVGVMFTISCKTNDFLDNTPHTEASDIELYLQMENKLRVFHSFFNQ